MRVERELSICGDCLQFVANGPRGMDIEAERLEEIEAGARALGPHLVAGGEELGFRRSACDVCKAPEYGERYAAAVLGEEDKPAVEDGPPKRRLVEQFAIALAALRNCEKSGNATFEAIWTAALESLAERLPSGSGFDSGSRLDLDESKPDKLVFATSFHHMNESGYYDGWTDHRVIVTPSFVHGFEMRITGRDKRQIKEYVAQCFESVLSELVEMP